MKAAIFLRDPAMSRRICRLWKCSGLDVQSFDSVSELRKNLEGTLLLGLDEFDRDILKDAVADFPKLHIGLWTAEPVHRVLRLAIEDARVSNLFGRPNFDAPPNDWELLMAARRWLRPEVGSPPFASYLNWGATGFQEFVHDTLGIQNAVARVHDFTLDLATPKWIGDAWGELTHELLMNALYTAPVDLNGKQRFAHDRKAEIELPKEEAATLRIACDGRTLGIQVVDPFGRLTRKHVFEGLARGLKGEMDSSGGGAGLGLATCHNAAMTLIYDVIPKERTEILAFIDLDIPRRDFRNRARSIHFFERAV